MQGVNVLRCSNCRKIIAEGNISHGEISIKCKCGLVNTIKAEPAKMENVPYQDRLNLAKKDYNYKEEKEQFVIKRLT